MKDHFISLLKYDLFANELILETMIKAGNPEKAIKLMAHTLAAQQIWLNRCMGLPASSGGVWPDRPAETFADTIAANSEGWLNFVQGLPPEGFETMISYKTSTGDSYDNKLIDILSHVINHGTHHRAQIGQHLIAAGIDQLPMTDYIFYVR